MIVTLPADAEPYLAAVRSLLASLPPDDRDELVDDLAAHLAELAADPRPPLSERLGAPSRYATEFVASLGVDVPDRDTPTRSAWAGVRDAMHLPASARQRLAASSSTTTTTTVPATTTSAPASLPSTP